MIKDIIDRAIRTKEDIEIEYSKDGVASNFFQLSHIEYFGKDNNCIIGALTPAYKYTDLIFRIDRIKDIQVIWNYILEEDIQFDKSGLYVLCWKGDNFLGYDLYSYEKGEKLLDKYQFGGMDEPIAFRRIPYYTGEYNHHWHAFDEDEEAKEDSIYVFAYTVNEGIRICNSYDDGFDFLLNESQYKTTEHSGIKYTVRRVLQGHYIVNGQINKDLNILAYSCCSDFSELVQFMRWCDIKYNRDIE